MEIPRLVEDFSNMTTMVTILLLEITLLKKMDKKNLLVLSSTNTN